jgi:hypothetical protein
MRNLFSGEFNMQNYFRLIKVRPKHQHHFLRIIQGMLAFNCHRRVFLRKNNLLCNIRKQPPKSKKAQSLELWTATNTN